MSDIFSRTRLLMGEDNLKRLKNSKVALFGIGGVGGYVAEALARCGVGSFLLVDNDVISMSNINRQIIALHQTVGKYKVDVMKERILDINPDACITLSKCFFLPENSGEIDLSGYSYIVDAVDTVSAKLEIVMQAEKHNVPVISSMGTGNKLDPSLLQIADIYDTSVCPLARVMRHELKKRGIKKLKCVYSTEKPIKPNESQMNLADEGTLKRQIPGSVAFVPSVAGLLMAGEVVRDLCG
ncbi:MAG: tRNA threonylcarbamoyladenosine dehydratase [Clostridium sp.]|nr:tRNA threonylcarbamoyladenosine dehydratase [Clostridium sp.]MCM1172649.1 tRNA threonylcarbamoyladenosine dehydratase [Clostridium sp.]MCM1207690.1 tRNA threonylcarbamoyladenosine dehydratase [Ruminococcus sp.]